ncbi:hypothetical protein SAMN06295910_1376 [Allosphingosinicella indica]|uniref:Uncharacterized protein n=2 Tax=Allosphingosinicella indica TaxID=941907 RepID=A0A1X7GAU7_9SPHN|nr:hypothetical protein SAMN06295910_1376 [Allosphingosinicella indica]
MSTMGDALKAFQSVLLMREDIRSLKEASLEQSERLTKLAEAHAALRDRVSRLEGIIEGAAMASGRAASPRIEG